MAIKKLQNDFTTPEQSKRLLELGVPADSANCCIRRVLTDDDCEIWIVDVFDFIGHVYDDNLPCWSVCRLMEIIHTCAGGYDSFFFTDSMCEYLINEIDYMIQNNKFDISLLEE